MGVLCDFFISDAERAPTYDGAAWPDDDRAQWKRLTTLALKTLWALLDRTDWRVEVMDRFEKIATYDSGERITERVPDELVSILSRQSESALDAVTERWVATQEMELSGWSAEDGREILESLVRLSSRSLETGRQLYVWNCV